MSEINDFQDQMNVYQSTTIIIDKTIHLGKRAFNLICSICQNKWVVRRDTLKDMIKKQVNGCRICHNRKISKLNEKEKVQEDLKKLHDFFIITEIDSKNWKFQCKTCDTEFIDQKYNILINSKNGCACTYCKQNNVLENWIEQFNDIQLIERIDPYTVKVKCKKCEHIWNAGKSNLLRAKNKWNTNGCLKCAESTGTGTSIEEQELFNFIKQHFQDAENRAFIDKTEVDIFIPSKQFAIEYCGSYWHGIGNVVARKNNKKDHFNKFKFCADHGIHLVTIFDYDWINKKDLIKNKLLGVLGKRKKLRSNQYSIKYVDWNLAKQFLSENHLMGTGEKCTSIGIFKEKELIGVATFAYPRIGTARFSSDTELELNRYATLYSCYNAINKIFQFLKLTNPNLETITSYADYCWSKYDQNIYLKTGFIFCGIKDPNYVWSKNRIIYKRTEAQKHKLSSLLGKNFNPELSERENMEINGFYRVYDCGAGIYKYIFK